VTCNLLGVSFNLPPNNEELIWAVPKDDLLKGGIEIICRGLILTRQGAAVRDRRVEEISRLEQKLLEVSGSLKQVVDANTTYEKRLCDHPVERELDAAQITELERLQVDTTAKNTRMKKTLEEVGHRVASLEEDVASLKQRKEAVEAELEKTIDNTMALIIQSFDLVVQ